MKKKLLLGVALLMTLNLSQAKADSWSNKLMEYGLPCAAGLAASFILASEDKFAIGAAACAATSAVTYYHRADRMEMDKKVDAMNAALVQEVKKEIIGSSKAQLVEEMKKEVYSEVNQSLLKDKEFLGSMLVGLKEEFAQYKTVIDQVLAVKLAEFEGKIPKEIESALMNGPFLKVLEEKLTLGLASKQQDIFVQNKDGIVKQCVSEALDQIVVKQIGIRESGIEVER